MSQEKELHPDQFELYDLTVVVEKIEGHCTCAMVEGDCFHMRGGKISLPDGADFCLTRCRRPSQFFPQNNVAAIPQIGWNRIATSPVQIRPAASSCASIAQDYGC